MFKIRITKEKYWNKTNFISKVTHINPLALQLVEYYSLKIVIYFAYRQRLKRTLKCSIK